MSSANTSSEANRDDGCEWYFGVPFPSKRKAATAPATQERELKVGDRVEVNVDRYPVKAGRGRRGKIKEVLSHGFTVKLDNSDDGFEWFFYPGDCEPLPPTFPPNTRVRIIRNTNRYAVGDTGTVTLSSDENVGVHMDNGRYWSFKPEDLVVVPQDGSVTAEKLSVASLSTLSLDCSASNVEHKFKDGDVVRALQSAPGQFTEGNTYTVRGGDSLFGYTVPVERDDRGSTTNGWSAKFFELVTSAPCPQDNEQTSWRVTVDKDTGYIAGLSPAQPCIVMRLENGQPRPSSWPHVHQSAADATKEAERLASVNPGKQFDVYQRVTGRVGDVQVREVA